MDCVEAIPARTRVFRVRHYNLAATLDSGQAFRWTPAGESWVSVIGGRWVRLRQLERGILAEVSSPTTDWQWLTGYLRTEVNLASVLRELPAHPLLDTAVRKHHGLRLLRQDPWECLASFILSSTKQIRHIKQIIDRLCREYGEPVPVPVDQPVLHAFPTAARLATVSEPELRSLGMGFRAPSLREAACRVQNRALDIDRLQGLPQAEARSELMQLPGVGRKIADCVLLFSLGFDTAFPMDVWILRTLQAAWFPRRRVTPRELTEFAEHHFGRYGGYAQQYLFHHARTLNRTDAAGRIP